MGGEAVQDLSCGIVHSLRYIQRVQYCTQPQVYPESAVLYTASGISRACSTVNSLRYILYVPREAHALVFVAQRAVLVTMASSVTLCSCWSSAGHGHGQERIAQRRQLLA